MRPCFDCTNNSENFFCVVNVCVVGKIIPGQFSCVVGFFFRGFFVCNWPRVVFWDCLALLALLLSLSLFPSPSLWGPSSHAGCLAHLLPASGPAGVAAGALQRRAQAHLLCILCVVRFFFGASGLRPWDSVFVFFLSMLMLARSWPRPTRGLGSGPFQATT